MLHTAVISDAYDGVLELRQLRYFVAVAEELHFGRAAERLQMTQPPLSQQIQRLERQLGLLLFERDRRSVALTAAGADLLDYARETVAMAATTASVAAQIREGAVGHVRIGFVGSALYGALPAQLHTLREKTPGIRLSVREMETGDQLDALASGELDLGVMRPPLEAGPIEYAELESEHLIVALPERHAAARHEEVPLAGLATESFVLFPRGLGVGYWESVAAACALAGFTPRIVHEAEHVHTMVGLVAAGFGVSLVPEGVHRLRLDGVVFRRLAAPAPTVRLALAWRRGPRSPVLRRAVDELLQGG